MSTIKRIPSNLIPSIPKKSFLAINHVIKRFRTINSNSPCCGLCVILDGLNEDKLHQKLLLLKDKIISCDMDSRHRLPSSRDNTSTIGNANVSTYCVMSVSNCQMSNFEIMQAILPWEWNEMPFQVREKSMSQS